MGVGGGGLEEGRQKVNGRSTHKGKPGSGIIKPTGGGRADWGPPGAGA